MYCAMAVSDSVVDVEGSPPFFFAPYSPDVLSNSVVPQFTLFLILPPFYHKSALAGFGVSLFDSPFE